MLYGESVRWRLSDSSGSNVFTSKSGHGLMTVNPGIDTLCIFGLTFVSDKNIISYSLMNVSKTSFCSSDLKPHMFRLSNFKLLSCSLR